MKDVRTAEIEQFCYHVPWPAAVIAVRLEGKDNAMAAAWHAPISFDPPLYGVSISPKRHTHDLIRRAREFTANFLPLEAAEMIASVGGSRCTPLSPESPAVTLIARSSAHTGRRSEPDTPGDRNR
jgi:flavin reductase (DIM6/NTAB) family NADH-FMN oxidoreductase RutF